MQSKTRPLTTQIKQEINILFLLWEQQRGGFKEQKNLSKNQSITSKGAAHPETGGG